NIGSRRQSATGPPFGQAGASPGGRLRLCARSTFGAGRRKGERQVWPQPHELPPVMIHLDSISKQNGHQLLFVEASAALHRGEKVGLVGPNGAGKTTLFRMITGQEAPDEGQVAVDRGITIGYFSQDVGEMA